MELERMMQILLSAPAILIYEVIAIGILVCLIIYMLKVRKRRKKEISDYRESEKKAMLDKALTNEKRGGVYK